MALSTREELLVMRQQARLAVAAGNRSALDVTLRAINRLRVILEWPARVAQRGHIEPYRFR